MRIPLDALPPQELFVGLGGLVFFGLAWLRGRLRGLDSRVVVAAVGSCGLAAVAGARLVWTGAALAGGETVGGWFGWANPWLGGFASLGAVAGGGGALIVVSRFLSDTEFWRCADVLVPAGLVGLAVARFGCLSAGCDFGAVADLPWSIRYPAGTPAWDAHLAAGLVDLRTPWSQPVHPFPLYLIGVTLTAVSIGGLTGSRSGMEAAAAGVAYLSCRFGVEWCRSPRAEFSVAGSLNLNQVLALIMLPTLCWCAWVRYRKQ